jgi:hypothetical protein
VKLAELHNAVCLLPLLCAILIRVEGLSDWAGNTQGQKRIIDVFLCGAACFVLARRFAADPAWRGWAIYSMATGILVAVFFIAADVVASPNPNAPAGLVQRLSIITGWGWIALVALRLLSKKTPLSS